MCILALHLGQHLVEVGRDAPQIAEFAQACQARMINVARPADKSCCDLEKLEDVCHEAEGFEGFHGQWWFYPWDLVLGRASNLSGEKLRKHHVAYTGRCRRGRHRAL